MKLLPSYSELYCWHRERNSESSSRWVQTWTACASESMLSASRLYGASWTTLRYNVYTNDFKHIYKTSGLFILAWFTLDIEFKLDGWWIERQRWLIYRVSPPIKMPDIYTRAMWIKGQQATRNTLASTFKGAHNAQPIHGSYVCRAICFCFGVVAVFIFINKHWH